MNTNNNHEKTVDDYKALHRIHMPRWVAGRVHSVNYDLVNHIKQELVANPNFAEIYGVEPRAIEHLRHNGGSMRSLLGTPFLMLSPSLPSIEDWRCFIDNTATTVAVDALRRKMPSVRDPLTTLNIQHHNRQFLDLIQLVSNMSVMSAPVLGMTTELAQYLATLPPSKLHRALERIRDLPLFQWRFRSPAFWYEFTASELTAEQIAHHIMSTTPFKAGELPHTATWGDLRLGRDTHEAYAAAMMAHGCRASTAANLFRLPHSKTRQMYQEIHGKRSPCGNLPNSLQWFVDKPLQRLHSTAFVWLYRAALQMGANTPQALIASADLYAILFASNPLLATDRACSLTRWLAASARLAIAPCRNCGTHYIVSNNESKIEMQHSFTCPACAGGLLPRVSKRASTRGANATSR